MPPVMMESEPPEAWMELPIPRLSPFNRIHSLLHCGSAISDTGYEHSTPPVHPLSPIRQSQLPCTAPVYNNPASHLEGKLILIT